MSGAEGVAPHEPMGSADAGDRTESIRIVEGTGCVERLGELCAELGGRVFLVTDPGLVAAGHVAVAERSLQAAGLVVERFDEVHHEPTTDDVEHARERARAFRPDLLLGFGGGSSIDVAKGTNFLLCCGGRMEDYRGSNTATGPLLPLVAVPTTAGTGSEMQSYALIATADSHRKMACGDPRARPRVALLDPELTLSVPRSVTARTGLDAIVHAVETAVTRTRNAVSDRLSTEAFRLAAGSFERVLEAPDDLEARTAMQRAAGLAGRAIENSMLGAAHGTANPLSANYGMDHGQAVGTMLPHVVRHNAGEPAVARRYAELARVARLAGSDDDTAQAVARLVTTLARWLERSGLPADLARSGVPAADLPRLAEEAGEQWTTSHNPRPLEHGELLAIYRAAHDAGGGAAL